ncbi:hypothetical protein B0J11DRAFT_574821 [Dendryphion nanum]|uniref:Uncharacterized protein n=1 Tax=Dendryphion nanum TaxID=256645 RepID=A0A9P9EKT6_9PLEO|nr:hypothetical protein B0J11DRAFT_574821 [Dendryphion nanum]
MRSRALFTLLLPTFAASHVLLPEARPASTPASAIAPIATASRSTLDLVVPGAAIAEKLDLRQAPANPNDPAPPKYNPNPAAPAVTTAPIPKVGEPVDTFSTTILWVETWIDKTFQTWVPKTVVVSFAAVPRPAALPGVGSVGMGSITGLTGVTKTVIAAAPARPTGWGVGVGVGLGVAAGLAGLIV